jgi:hypothetical protein
MHTKRNSFNILLAMLLCIATGMLVYIFFETKSSPPQVSASIAAPIFAAVLYPCRRRYPLQSSLPSSPLSGF